MRCAKKGGVSVGDLEKDIGGKASIVTLWEEEERKKVSYLKISTVLDQVTNSIKRCYALLLTYN